MNNDYERLDVYKRAFAVALQIHKFTLTLPQIENYALANQLRRASKGICANIAEGQAKQYYSQKEFGRLLLMAIGSCEEVRVWLKFCIELDYLEKTQWDIWDREYQEISRMLGALAKKQKT